MTSSIPPLLTDIRAQLTNLSTKQTQHSAKRFFKETIKLYGVKTPQVSAIAKQYEKLTKEMDKAETFKLCQALWQSGYLEESFIACHFSYLQNKHYTQSDIITFENWIEKYVTNWASCDTFCNHTVGTLIEMYPQELQTLKKWTHSPNRWMRRAAAVSLIIPARNGLFLKDILEIADALLLDSDDLVQKGYGWMLKAASQAHQTEVFNYVMRHKHQMPRTALRYAIEKMPLNLKKQAMEK